MLDQHLRRLLSLYPRGVSSSQLLWRLKDGGLRPSAEDLLQALVALADRGEVRRDDVGRWHANRLGASGVNPGKPPDASGRQPVPGMDPPLFALPLAILPETMVDEEPEEPEPDQPGSLAPPRQLLRYYAATQRNDPRGRITLFADQHSQSWQLVTMPS